MSRFSVSTDRKANWTLICDHRSRHHLHVSVMSQHMRCQSPERLEPSPTTVRQNSTSTVKLLPPTILLGDPPLPENPTVAFDRSRNIVTSIATESSANSRSRRRALASRPISYGSFSSRSAIHLTAHGLASGDISPPGPSVGLGSDGSFPNMAVINCVWCAGSCTKVCAHLSLRTLASTSQSANFQKRSTSLWTLCGHAHALSFSPLHQPSRFWPDRSPAT